MNSSKVNDYLFIGTTPKTADYATLHKLGITLVINMRVGFPPARDPISPPVISIWLPTIDSPLIPIPIRSLMKGAAAAQKVIEAGGVVYTHCSHGRHRGPAMGACILVAQGMDPETAMRLIEQQRPVADLHSGYIQRRILKFAQAWKEMD